MPVQLIDRTPGAYAYPLLIKQLLHTPLAIAPEQEITYLGGRRHSYRVLRERIGRLASALAGLGIEAGHTVAMMDWDSHRYLDCFFAVPMMGAVLQTVNVRLSPEQILYTLNHARADVVLVNAEFLPILAEIAPRLESVRHFVLIEDAPAAGPAPVAFVGEYEALLAAASPDYDFPDFDENATREQLRDYLVVKDMVEEFKADCLGWQYQLGLIPLRPPSDFAEGLFNSTCRPESNGDTIACATDATTAA